MADLPHFEVTDAMAIAFQRAITDGPIGREELEDIKTGLRAALACSTQLDAYAAAKVAEERERLCAAIKAADDKAVGEADYMLTSDDCISVIRGTWAGFEHAAAIRGTEAASRGE